MGCDCNSVGDYAGLGQIDPVSIAASLTTAKAAWDNLLNTLGVGAGRREADIIVPEQNRMVSDVITPISAYLDGAVNKGVPTDCTTILNWTNELSAAKQNWLFFLHNTQWQDGRAAQQAEATLAPYFASAEGSLQQLTTKYNCHVVGGIGSSIGNTITGVLTTPSGDLNWPIIAAIGVGAYFLLKRK